MSRKVVFDVCCPYTNKRAALTVLFPQLVEYDGADALPITSRQVSELRSTLCDERYCYRCGLCPGFVGGDLDETNLPKYYFAVGPQRPFSANVPAGL